MAVISNLVIKVSADSSGLAPAFANATVIVNNFGKAFEDNEKKATSSFQRISAGAVAMGNLMSQAFNVALRGVGFLVNQMKEAIDVATQFNNALIGLTSVARSFGISSDSATAAAKQLSNDGLLPLGDAAKGLKNLLMTGFGLDQSVTIMNAFKDSATYARQANYGYAESIVTATEGLKNMRSVQVDNVGITKNISVIMKEQGFQMADLTDKVKGAAARLAFYNGLLREASSTQGDAARSLETMSGQYTVLQSSYRTLQGQIGDYVVVNKSVMVVLRFVGQLVRDLTTYLAQNNRGFLLVSDAVLVLVKTFSLLIQWADYVQTGFHGISAALNGTFAVYAKVAGAIFKVAEKVNTLQGNPVLAREAADAYIWLTGAAEGFAKEQRDNIDNSIKWGNTLQDAKAAVVKLAGEVEKAKGQVLDIGKASRKAGDTVDYFGNAIDKAGKNGKNAAGSWHDVAQAIESVEKKIEAVTKDFDTLGKEARDQAEAGIKDIADRVKEIGENWEIAKEREYEARDGANEVRKEIAGIATEIDKIAGKRITDPFRTAFLRLADDLPGIIADAFKNDRSIAAAIGRNVGGALMTATRQAISQLKQGEDLTGQQKALGLAGVGLSAGFAGYDIGASTTSKTKGVLGGAAAGATAGLALAPFTGGLSIAVGAGVGAIAGFFGSRSAQKKQREELAANQKALLEQYGGMVKLQKLATSLKVNIASAFDTTKPEEFQAAVDRLNKALADQKTRIDALGSAIAGVNTRAALFAAQFATALDKGDKPKIAEIAQRTQPEFERLGLIIRDTFAGLIKETGDAYGALTQLAPAFAVLQQGVTDFGLTGNAVIDELLADFKLVNDEALKPLFEQIQADGQILAGLVNANSLSPEGFQAIAADIGHSLQGIVDKGGDVKKALALSQPILQTLWEAQQKYGTITDETTQKLLTQAEEQGLVGEQMKGVNEKILDVLLTIADVLGAKLPDYFKKLVPPAKDAAKGIEDAFNNIDVRPVRVRFDVDETGVPRLGAGGVVRRPTLVLAGESGTEVIAPLSSLDTLGGRNGSAADARVTANITINAIDGASVERVVESDAFAAAFQRTATRNPTGVGTTIRTVNP